MTKSKKNKQRRRLSSNLDAKLSSFFASHSIQLIILGIVFLVLFFLSTLPYFNIILNKTAVLFVVWVLAVFLLKLSGRVSIIGALLLLGICPFLLIFENEPLAEETANLAFGFLVIGVIQEFIKYLKEERK